MSLRRYGKPFWWGLIFLMAQGAFASNNRFAFDLMQQIVKAQPAGDVFLSPFSVSTTLQMVGNGAAGRTKIEMKQVLHTIGMADATLNASLQAFNQRLTARPDVTLTLANGIWVREGFHLQPDFVAANQLYFGAELAALDFDQPAAAQTINDWASKQTHGKIPKIVSYPFDPTLRLILANAIYFKGKWATPFDKKSIQPRDFHPVDGPVTAVPMMSQSQSFDYEETAGYQAVRLPYTGGLEMEVFLPATNQTPAALLATFGAGKIWSNNVQPAFQNRPGLLMLPKFKMDFSIKLNEPLQQLGMKSAFDPHTANFTHLADQPLFIGEVFQKSYVAVNEEGTEAAAVTGMPMLGVQGIEPPPPPPFEMIVDRPFFFVIEDTTSGCILFMGVVNHPLANGI